MLYIIRIVKDILPDSKYPSAVFYDDEEYLSFGRALATVIDESLCDNSAQIVLENDIATRYILDWIQESIRRNTM